MMKVSGSLQAMPVSEVLMWISQCRKSGILEIRTPDLVERIAFDEGFLTFSSSSDQKATFGRILIKKGYVTEEQHAQARRICDEQKIAVAKVLLDMNFIAESEIVRLLRKKAESELFRLFRISEGEFEFIADAVPNLDMVPLRVDVARALLHVTQQMDEKDDFDFDSSGVSVELPQQ